MESECIIRDYHDRGRDKLINKAPEEFAGGEVVPFKRFAQNAVFYYTLLLSIFLYESFKENVCAPVVEKVAYPTTLRRKVIDIAAKIVRHAGQHFESPLSSLETPAF
jgi:hypothetical protein